MPVKHEPRQEFVDRLESQLTAEARRRSRIDAGTAWTRRSPARTALAAACLVILSMAAGGAAVDAAYRSQNNERRDQLASLYERRLELARQKMRLALDDLNGVQRKVSIGLATNTDLLDSRLRVKEAEAEVRTTELQLEEVRITGREPLTSLSAPLVKGRDFVSERLTAEMDVAAMAYKAATQRLQDLAHRVEIGVAAPIDYQAERLRVVELEAALEAFQRKLAIRKKFVGNDADAMRTDLMGLEIEADLRYRALKAQYDLARQDATRIAARVQKGVADKVELTRANVKVLELETDLARTELDLALIRRRLQGKD